MTVGAAEMAAGRPGRGIVISALGLIQILAWGSSYYLPAVLAKPIAEDTGWPFAWVIGGLSLGLLVAGLASPRVGAVIQRRGGRPVLAFAALALAAGQLCLALAPSLPVYILAWILMGLGMGAGLYDAAFATLGRLYGLDARRAITTLTLFGGFASTLCWPLSAFLLAELGWRGACAAYAAVHLGVVLPLALLVLPREARRDPPGRAAADAAAAAGSRLLFGLTAIALMLSSAISALLSVHLLTLLQARDIALAAAVALGALVGPAQVAARAIEMLIARYHHPIWTKAASVLLVAAGVSYLCAGLPGLSLALLFYGAGIGLESIARGTLPLAFFGPARYPSLMGALALPSLLVQALAPFLGALALQRWGAGGLLAALSAAAALNFLVVAALFRCSRPVRGLRPAAR